MVLAFLPEPYTPSSPKGSKVMVGIVSLPCTPSLSHVGPVWYEIENYVLSMCSEILPAYIKQKDAPKLEPSIAYLFLGTVGPGGLYIILNPETNLNPQEAHMKPTTF